MVSASTEVARNAVWLRSGPAHFFQAGVEWSLSTLTLFRIGWSARRRFEESLIRGGAIGSTWAFGA
jgi:hypothetical protein